MTIRQNVAKALLEVVREWEHCQIFDEQMGPQMVRAALKAGLKLPKKRASRTYKRAVR